MQKGGYLRQKLDQGQRIKVTVMEGEGEGDTKAVFLEPKVPGKGVLKDRAKSPKDSVPILRSSTIDIFCLPSETKERVLQVVWQDYSKTRGKETHLKITNLTHYICNRTNVAH